MRELGRKTPLFDGRCIRQAIPYNFRFSSSSNGVARRHSPIAISQSLSEHLSNYRGAWAVSDSITRHPVGISRELPGSFHRKNLVNALLRLDRQGPQTVNKESPQEPTTDSTVQLARLATAESLAETVALASNLLSTSANLDGSDALAKATLQTLSATLNHLAQNYFAKRRENLPHQATVKNNQMNYLGADTSIKSGYYKQLLDVASQFMHDAMVKRSITHLHWLNHFALLKMGTADEHVGSVAFDMWFHSFRSWLTETNAQYDSCGNSAGNHCAEPSQDDEMNAVLNSTAIYMIEWCEKSQRFRQSSELKRVAMIWSLFGNALRNRSDKPFQPTTHLFAAMCDVIRGAQETGGLLSHVMDTLRKTIPFSMLLHSPWSLLRQIIAALPMHKAISVIMLRHKIEYNERNPGERRSRDASSLPYHLLHCMLNVFVQNKCIAESEHLFRNNVKMHPVGRPFNRRTKRDATLAQARYHVAEEEAEQREHLILLILSLYAYLPVPDLQSALEIVENYVPEDAYTSEHFALLIRAASNDPDAANALYIEACSRGISLARKGYESLYFSLGKGTRWMTQSAKSNYAELESPELDSHLSIPSLPDSEVARE